MLITSLALYLVRRFTKGVLWVILLQVIIYDAFFWAALAEPLLVGFFNPGGTATECDGSCMIAMVEFVHVVSLLLLWVSHRVPGRVTAWLFRNRQEEVADHE